MKIIDILRKYGPMSSSKLKYLLMSTGLSDVAARKQISRSKAITSKDGVISFTYFYLPKRELFLYLREQFCSDHFFHELIKSHEESRTIYAHTFFALDLYDGILPSFLLGKVSGSPERLKGHIPLERLENQLIKGQLIYAEKDIGLGRYFVKNNLNHNEHLGNFNSLRNQLIIEEILINSLSEWIKLNGFGSFNKVKIRKKDDMPKFCNHHWDICAPSYLRPIATFDKNSFKNGFFVADVIFSTVNSKSIQAFISKVQRCRNMRNSRPFLAMLVVKHAEKEAFNIARNMGILITTVSNLLNTDISNLLSELLNTLNNAVAVVVENPNKINDLFKSLSKIEGATINLRGALFEMIAGHIINKTQNVEKIDLNRKISYEYNIKDTEDQRGRIDAEIDVVGLRNSSVICYECKGYIAKNKITKKMIEEWLDKIGYIYSYYKSLSHYKDSSVSFEFWTTSDFEKDALEHLKLKQSKTKKYSIKWKNGGDILNILREEKLTEFIHILNQHYLKNPLSKFMPSESLMEKKINLNTDNDTSVSTSLDQLSF